MEVAESAFCSLKYWSCNGWGRSATTGTCKMPEKAGRREVVLDFQFIFSNNLKGPLGTQQGGKS